MIVITLASAGLAGLPAHAGSTGSTILALAIATADLSTLETAVLAANPAVATTLDSSGNYTVFAPNNAAFTEYFASLTTDELNALLADEGSQLTNILLYHVVPTELFASSIPVGTTFITTLLGEDLEVFNDGSNIFVNGNQVVVADIDATNGVVHIIDGVLLPPTVQVPNRGEITIGAGANVVTYTGPGDVPVFIGSTILTLPQDFDGNGFDTFVITDSVTVNEVEYYGIFVGSRSFVYVVADQVVRTR